MRPVITGHRRWRSSTSWQGAEGEAGGSREVSKTPPACLNTPRAGAFPLNRPRWSRMAKTSVAPKRARTKILLLPRVKSDPAYIGLRLTHRTTNRRRSRMWLISELLTATKPSTTPGPVIAAAYGRDGSGEVCLGAAPVARNACQPEEGVKSRESERPSDQRRAAEEEHRTDETHDLRRRHVNVHPIPGPDARPRDREKQADREPQIAAREESGDGERSDAQRHVEGDHLRDRRALRAGVGDAPGDIDDVGRAADTEQGAEHAAE